ncbi:MAG TPA: hypothetical protein PK054_06755 [Anaerohalosphaeraceae bacterium]|nr:hypothetical protein [Anaerohalosphaeraceae bacterium]HOL88585.1 hypothetical protein [Anaerohalosphaeraceae bacterium]HPP56268.1 hypothetical protein [Anaerohalosphaeraceae bacterium]
MSQEGAKAEKPKKFFSFFWKLLLLLFGVGLFVLGMHFAYSGLKIHKKVQQLSRPLLETDVDFSAPTEYTFSLPAVEYYFHGLGLGLEVNVPGPVQEKACLKGLQCTAILVKGNGEPVGTLDLNENNFFVYSDYEPLLGTISFHSLESFSGYEAENSRLTLKVIQGADGLKGCGQRLTVFYRLCGLEKQLASICAFFAAILGTAGLGITIPLTLHLWKAAKQPHQPLQGSGAP